jgi:hypothetical protein
VHLRDLAVANISRTSKDFFTHQAVPVLLFGQPTAQTSMKVSGETDPMSFKTIFQESTDDTEVIETSGASIVQVAKSNRNPFHDMITVGRAANNDIVLADPTISKIHCYFRQGSKGEWILTDLGSRNGTLVNGRRLTPKESCFIFDGTCIAFAGEITVQFKTPEGLWRIINDLLQ